MVLLLGLYSTAIFDFISNLILSNCLIVLILSIKNKSHFGLTLVPNSVWKPAAVITNSASGTHRRHCLFRSGWLGHGVGFIGQNQQPGFPGCHPEFLAVSLQAVVGPLQGSYQHCHGKATNGPHLAGQSRRLYR